MLAMPGDIRGMGRHEPGDAIGIVRFSRSSRITFIGSRPSLTRLICSRNVCRNIAMPVSEVASFRGHARRLLADLPGRQGTFIRSG
jgi:hypothetical protein